MTTFGDNLKYYREQAKISRLSLAGKTGLHYSHLSKIENDQQGPNLETILKLAEGIGVSASSLLGGVTFWTQKDVDDESPDN